MHKCAVKSTCTHNWTPTKFCDVPTVCQTLKKTGRFLAYCMLWPCVCERERQTAEASLQSCAKTQVCRENKAPPFSSLPSRLPKNAEPLEIVAPAAGFLAVSSWVMKPPSPRSLLGRGTGRRGGRSDITRHERGSWKRRHLALYESLSLPPVIRHVSLSGGSAPN